MQEKLAPLRLTANMRKAEKVKRLRPPLAVLLSKVGRELAKLDQPRFLGVKLQSEALQPLLQVVPKLIGVRFLLESYDDVVGIPNDDHVTARTLLTPRVGPEVEDIKRWSGFFGQCDP